MGVCEGSQPVTARSLHQNPLVLNLPCPIPTGGAPVVLWTSIFLCSGPGRSKGFWGFRNLPPEISCVLWPVLAASSSCGSRMWFPVGVFPHYSTQTPQLPFLSFLLFAAGSPPSTNIMERPLSWISKRQESPNQTKC